MSRLPRDLVIFGTVEISNPRFEVEGLRDGDRFTAAAGLSSITDSRQLTP